MDHQVLHRFLDDMRILAGDEIGPPNMAWQDVASRAAINAMALGKYLDDCATGRIRNPVFPSPDNPTDEC